MVISGKTRLVGLIGYPLEHTLSPLIHNSLFEKFGLDACYVPLPVKPERLTEAIAGLRAFGFLGANVTMPHKTEVIRLLDFLDTQAEISESVNTIRIEADALIGYNTDGTGFCDSIQKEVGLNIEGLKVVLLGAGGAARSIAVALAARGCCSISIVNRTVEKAEYIKSLIEKTGMKTRVSIFALSEDYRSAIEDARLIVNATPLEDMEREGYRFPFECIAPGSVVCDLKYVKTPSVFLSRASLHKAVTVDGKGMLIYQAALAFRLWTGIDPPIDFMRRVLQSAI